MKLVEGSKKVCGLLISIFSHKKQQQQNKHRYNNDK
jgi:hypothetical protein